MGADFIFSICRIPGITGEEFAEAVRQRYSSMDVRWLQAEMDLLHRCGLWHSDMPLDVEEARACIIENVIESERRLSANPRDTSRCHLEGKEWYISGCQSWREGTESMGSINWLGATDCEELGHE
tara:strand:- start:681 stop:1055 length:375 start_codon:yes stop_codon:yes gene_type:complete